MATTSSGTVYLADYIGNGGVATVSGTGTTGTASGVGAVILDGNSQVSSGRMRNGASNTLIVGEKSVSIAGAFGGNGSLGGDPGDISGIYYGYTGDTVAFAFPSGGPINDPRPGTTMTKYNVNIPVGQSSVTISNLGYGSAHPGGMNALFGDGSVKTITYGISPTTFTAISNRNNTLVVDMSDF